MADTWQDPDYQFHIDQTDSSRPRPPDGAPTALDGEFSLWSAGLSGDFITGMQTQWNATGVAIRNQSDFATALNEFVHLYLGPRSENARPTDWDSFISVWRNHAYNDNPTNITPGLRTLAQTSFLELGPASTTSLGYWEPFEGAEFLAGTPSFPNTTLSEQQAQAFEDTFSAFILNYEFDEIQFTSGGDPITTQQPGGPPSPGQAFINGWADWLQRTTVAEQGFPGLTGIPQDGKVQSYKTIYDAYLPGSSDETFQEDLVAFADRMYKKDGYFYPNHFIERWVDEVKSASLSSASRAILNPIVQVERIQQALILNEIFDLLVDMIGVIQQATAAMAQRLRFYSEYQNQMTKLMDKVAIFHGGDRSELAEVDKEKVDPDDEESTAERPKYGDTRADANGVSQAALDYLRAHRDMVGDETKQLQTTVNQLNDAASQQGNIATAILQQLSGILTLIFR